MHVQAIITKYVGPTNFKGSRIKATASAGSVTVSYDSGLSSDANHDNAAYKLAEKFGWHGTYNRGGMPGDKGNVYVATSASTFDGFKR